jgi:hypothetical protein
MFDAAKLKAIARLKARTVLNLRAKKIKLNKAKKTQKQAMFTKKRTSFKLATEVVSGT